jgi:hypothetical protein
MEGWKESMSIGVLSPWYAEQDRRRSRCHLEIVLVSNRLCCHNRHIQFNSHAHSRWDKNQLAVTCAVGSAPIPRRSLFIHIKYRLEGVKSKTDLFHY